VVPGISLPAPTLSRGAQTYYLLLYRAPKGAVKAESSREQDGRDRHARSMMHRNHCLIKKTLQVTRSHGSRTHR
jgi:hypothetical protein